MSKAGKILYFVNYINSEKNKISEVNKDSKLNESKHKPVSDNTSNIDHKTEDIKDINKSLDQNVDNSEYTIQKPKKIKIFLPETEIINNQNEIIKPKK